MDLKHLRAFLTVADTGNVTRAASMLNLVQPAVSRQIRLLEEDIGVALFERERHGMLLTTAGQALVGYARRALLEIDRARAEVAGAAAQQVSGLVTLGLLPSTVDMLSSAFVSAVAASHPGIRVRIAVGYAGNLMQWLAAGEVDAALLYGAERSSDVQTTPLIKEALWAIGSPQSKLRPSRPISLAELAGYRLVLPSAPHGIRTLVEHACAVSKVTLNISAETNALSVQRSLVLGGHGLTILPPIAVADDLRSRRLRGAPIAEPGISRTIVLALPLNRPTGQHIRCAVELLEKVARGAIDAGTWPEGRWLGS
ncbi:LysR family transcriptional regulator [Ottowia sp.]|uniref:LysR family transcriptional regulator n=1 Tax=Ottowia sp. TaxID=1898956 RepID=UPI0039E5CCD7